MTESFGAGEGNRERGEDFSPSEKIKASWTQNVTAMSRHQRRHVQRGGSALREVMAELERGPEEWPVVLPRFRHRATTTPNEPASSDLPFHPRERGRPEARQSWFCSCVSATSNHSRRSTDFGNISARFCQPRPR